MKAGKKLAAVLLLTGALVLPCEMATVAAEDDVQPYVQSDTTVDFPLAQTETYAFCFTLHGTKAQPHIAAGNGAVLHTEQVTHKTVGGLETYWFRVRAVGTPGQASGIYTTLPGQQAVRHCTIMVAEAYVKSDTKVDFTLPQQNAYQFRMEVVGPDVKPNIAVGNGKVLRTESVVKRYEHGNAVYYFQTRAVGAPGQKTAVYTTLPGQHSVRHCTITVGNPKFITLQQAEEKANAKYATAKGDRHQGYTVECHPAAEVQVNGRSCYLLSVDWWYPSLKDDAGHEVHGHWMWMGSYVLVTKNGDQVQSGCFGQYYQSYTGNGKWTPGEI